MKRTDNHPFDSTKAQAESTSEFLTVEELQTELNVGRTAAYTFAREHGLRVGRLLRVPRAALKG